MYYSKMKSIVSSAAFLDVLFFSANAASNNANGLRATKPNVGSGTGDSCTKSCIDNNIIDSPGYMACMCNCDPYCGRGQVNHEDWDDHHYYACLERYSYSINQDDFDLEGYYEGTWEECDCYCEPDCSCNNGSCGDGPFEKDGTKGPPKIEPDEEDDDIYLHDDHDPTSTL